VEVNTMLRTSLIAVAFTAATALGTIGCKKTETEVQEAPAPIGRPNPPPERGGRPGEYTAPMGGPHMMMGGQCMQFMQQRSSGIDQATRAIDEAKQSQDHAKMSAALDLARAELQDIKTQHEACVETMRSRGGTPPQG
jgi:hypothetical protein